MVNPAPSPTAPAPAKGALPGRDALVKALAAFWAHSMRDGSDILDFPGHALNRLAIPVSKAFEVAGYGKPLNSPQADPAPPALVLEDFLPQRLGSPEWDGRRLVQRRQALRDQGVKDWAAQAAAEAGLQVREAARRVKAYEEAPALPANTGKGWAAGLGKRG